MGNDDPGNDRKKRSNEPVSIENMPLALGCILDDVAEIRDKMPDGAASEANAYAIKLAALKDLFDPNRSAELDTNLTEADIDALAAEFFGTQTEKEHKQSYAPSTPFRYQ